MCTFAAAGREILKIELHFTHRLAGIYPGLLLIYCSMTPAQVQTCHVDDV